MAPPNQCNFALPCQQFVELVDSPALEIDTNGPTSVAALTINSTAGIAIVAISGLTEPAIAATSGEGPGIRAGSELGPGVDAASLGSNAVQGHSDAGIASGVYGENFTTNPAGGGAWGGYGVAGRAGTGPWTMGVFGDQTGSGWAGYFNGKAYVAGKAQMASSGMQIDHPLEPHSKYLNHSAVQSGDMKNLYDGVVTLDSQGSAWVELPSWFEALNRDFRYQLTPIGSHAPVYVAQEIANNRFQIAGGKSSQRVSWLVTGIRRDVWAEKNPIAVEEDKDPVDQGKFLYPLEAGQPKEMGIPYSRSRGLDTVAAHRERIEQERKSRAGG